jgi:hypothetical protein
MELFFLNENKKDFFIRIVNKKMKLSEFIVFIFNLDFKQDFPEIVQNQK